MVSHSATLRPSIDDVGDGQEPVDETCSQLPTDKAYCSSVSETLRSVFNEPADGEQILLGDILTLRIDSTTIMAEVLWTSAGICGILYLNDSGDAALPSLVESWFPCETLKPVTNRETGVKVSDNIFVIGSKTLGQGEMADGVVVDVTLETGRLCRGIARWSPGQLPTVQLFFR